MSFVNKVSTALIILLVIYVFLDAIAFSPQASPVKPLGHRRKILAFLALGIGLSTFFGTLVDISPALLNRSQWSALDIVSGIREGAVPPSKGGGLGIVLFDLALAYLLMLFALFALSFSRSQKLLKVIGLIGCLLSLEALGRGEESFQLMFFGLVPAHGNPTVEYGSAMYVLPLALSALLLISMLDSLDL